MFIKVEPAEFFMYRVIMIFDLDSPDSEDCLVRDYLAEEELEPKYQRTGDYEGRQSELMQFGGCYLGRHLGHISQIQRRCVEEELLAAEIERLLAEAPDPVALPAPRRAAVMQELAQSFHQDSAFQTAETGELAVTLDGPAVRQAARQLLDAPPQ